MPNHVLMLAAVLFVDTPKRLLNLGLGGGVFERFFRTHLPGLIVTTVEKSPVVIRLARDCFDVQPDGVFALNLSPTIVVPAGASITRG